MFDIHNTNHADIVCELLQTPATIAPKYFYDARGSAIFEEITRLPEYYPTRTESAIMAEHAQSMAQAIGAGRTVIELGAGNCQKARALCTRIRARHYVAVDISQNFMLDAVNGMREAFPKLPIDAVVADITKEWRLPAWVPREKRLVFYPGSSIGNFDPSPAQSLLTGMRSVLGPDGMALIGIDLVKDVTVLNAAYDDAAGVTAAFNLNMLEHINHLIGANFDTQQWRHQAFFNGTQSRIEMHLEALQDVTVSWKGGKRNFARGERIHTESSYKYTQQGFVELLQRSGFIRTQVWTDERKWFGVVLAQ